MPQRVGWLAGCVACWAGCVQSLPGVCLSNRIDQQVQGVVEQREVVSRSFTPPTEGVITSTRAPASRPIALGVLGSKYGSTTRIAALGGTPAATPASVTVAADAKAMLEAALAAEVETIE